MKKNKFTSKSALVLITACLAVLQLSACQQMKADILHVPISSISQVTYSQTANFANSGTINGGTKSMGIIAGIISPDVNAENILGKISNPQDYDSIVLLAPTSYKSDNAAVFTYETEGVLEAKNIIFDKDSIEKITQQKIAYSLGKVGELSSWNISLLQEMSSKFKNAKVTILSVNDESTEEDIKKLAAFLNENLTENGMVLALSDFEKNAKTNINNYIIQYTNTVLTTCDTNEFANLPQQNTKALEVLGGFIGSEKNCELIAKDWNGNTLQALYRFNENSSGNLTAENSQSNSQTAKFSGGTLHSDGDKIYLVSFGDIMLGRYVRTLMDAKGLDYPFEKMDEYYLKTNDILLANLEGPIAKNAIKTSKTIAFRFMPDTADLLKKYHFDVLSLANNHTYDMGNQGYADSKEVLTEKGLIYFGDPKGINEDSTAKMEIRGQKIAFVGMEEVVYDIKDDEAVAKIKQLIAEGYMVIPVVHWGVEYTHTPNSRQKELAHKFIDAGAIMVIAHHPHVIQAFEEYNGRPIFYSLGNAVFDQYFSADTQEGLTLAAVITNNSIEINLLPIKIDRSQMRLMSDDETKEFLTRFADYGEYSADTKNAILSGKLTFGR